MMRRAFITGITGQDGSYLAEYLAADGVEVFGLVRGQDNPKASWLQGLVPNAHLISGDLQDESSLRAALKIARPDMIYNLGALSSPALAWGQPLLAAEITALGPMRLLNAMASECPDAHFIQASSISQHGPYGAAKQFAHMIAQDYRSRGFKVSTVAFGAHHSVRRGQSFFSRKVTKAAADIREGRQARLQLGPLTRSMDWGWAQDFMMAVAGLADRSCDDYVMSTGSPRHVKEWIDAAFTSVDLVWHDHVDYNQTELGHATDVDLITAQPGYLGDWVPRQDFEQLAAEMVQADLEY